MWLRARHKLRNWYLTPVLQWLVHVMPLVWELGAFISFLPLIENIKSLLWEQRLPSWIQQQLVSFSNPDGNIFNNDLEPTGSVVHNVMLAMAADVRKRMTYNVYNNAAAVFFQRKGATTTPGAPSHLLRLQALHQQHFRYVPQQDYIPGQSYVMVDFLS